MKKLERKHHDGWYYNPDELRKLTEKVNGQEYGESMSMEEVEAVLLAIDEQPHSTVGELEEITEELWDDFSWLVDDDIDSLQMVAGTSVMKESDFKRAVKQLVKHLTTKTN